MNKNRDGLSDDELREKMDFDRFINDYKPPSIYRGWKFYGFLAFACIVAVGYWLLQSEETDLSVPGKKAEDRTFIKPPIDGLDVADTTYELKTDIDTILFYSSGSSLSVPANAFLDKQGKIVHGRVYLHYRELHDATDFFISGIPMTYDSGGVQYHFESAGMLEISASQNGEKLFANPDEAIKIQMVSDIKGSRFNTYFLDTVERKWNYVEEGRIATPADNNGFQNSFSRLQAPLKADAVLPRFDIAFDKKQFPELATYEGVSFQVGADEKYYDPKLAMKEWDDVKIQRHPDGVHYLITFSNPGETHVFKVQPVFNGVDYAHAKSMYEEKLKSYEAGLSSGRLAAVSRKRKMDSLYTSQYNNMQSANSSARNLMRSNSEKQAAENLVFRQFTLSRFGVWNSDCPQSLPQGKLIIARFTDMKSKRFEFDHVYLVEKGSRALYNYYPDKFEKFSYNPKSKNMLWAVTKESKLAVFGTEEFEKIKNDKDSSLFKMKVIEKKVSSPAEIRQLLGI